LNDFIFSGYEIFKKIQPKFYATAKANLGCVNTLFLPCWGMLDTRSVKKHDLHHSQKVQEKLLGAAIIDMAFKHIMKLASEAHFSFSFRFGFSKKVIVAFAAVCHPIV